MRRKKTEPTAVTVYTQGVGTGLDPRLHVATFGHPVLPWPHPTPLPYPSFHVGHILGDSEVVAHCFSGDTKFLTENGWMTFADAVDTEQMVLNPAGGRGGFSQWTPAHVHEFGEQQLWEVKLQRNKRTKTIRATAGHRWLVRGTKGFVTTEDLIAGHRLDSCLPRCLIGSTTPSPFGIAHGAVYGDGTRSGRASRITLWGDKDQCLAPYFAECRQSPTKTPNGVLGLSVSDLPGYFKDRPSLGESAGYLYGFLAGWFAADGNVSSQGQVQLCSASLEDLEFACQVALSLGIATYDIVTKTRQGYGDEPSELHSVEFIKSSLRENFFLVPSHRQRFMAASDREGSFERLRWTVVSVTPTDIVEPVYCAVVPDGETFTIEGFILTGNCPFCGSGDIVAGADQTISCSFCNRSFLVMEQPQYNSMPGQPGASTDATMPGSEAPAVPGEDPVAEEGEPGVEAPTTDAAPSTPPAVPVNPQTDPEELKKAPAFSFSSSLKTVGPFEDGIARIKAETDYRVLLKMIDDNARLMQMAPGKAPELTAQSDAARERIKELTKTAGRDESIFRTASGYRVDEDDFVKHVAFSVDRDYMVRG